MSSKKFNAGDKVRFLNEIGEGIVRGFEKGLVKVEIDGFIIPYVAEQLVLIQDSQPEQKVREYVKPAEEGGNTAFKVTDTVYVAYEDNENDRLTVWLINNTAFEILFSWGLSVDQKYKGKEYGIVSSTEKFLLAEIGKEQIEEYSNFRIQIIFHTPDELREMIPVNEYVRVKSARFYRKGSYLRSKLTKNPALIVDLLDISGEQETLVREDTWKGDGVRIVNVAEHIYTKERGELPRMSSPHINRTGQLEKEVDLHIEELLDSFRGMSNAEILRVQLNHFQRELDDAIARRMKKVTFIHGIGNGVLKNEIRRMLASYDGVKYFDAPYSRYGFGATEVEIY